MRVLMVDSERTWRGGEAQLRLLVKGLLSEGVEVSLAAPRNSEIHLRTRELAMPFHPVSIAGGMDGVSAWRLRGVVRHGGYGIVHAHSSHAHSVAFLATAAMHARPRLVVSRRVDFPVGKHAASRLTYLHGADMFLAISSGVREALLAGGVAPERIRMVPSGVDLQKFEKVGDGGRVRSEFGIAADAPVVGNVAALAPHKSQVDLVRAARIVADRVPSVRFLIVGEGELRDDLEAQVRELGLEGTVKFTGFREDVLDVMAAFTCFVMPSYLEGLCTSIMDAQAMGIPVVATDTGGIPDIVRDGVTGLLVAPRKPEQLAVAIIRLLEDETLRRRLADAGVRQAVGYDYREMVYKTLDAYRGLMGA